MKTVVEGVAERTGMPASRAEDAVRAVFATIEDALGRGERVWVRGFGAFEAVTVRGRPGRNFRTGEALPATEKRTLRFRPGARVLRAVEGGE